MHAIKWAQQTVPTRSVWGAASRVKSVFKRLTNRPRGTDADSRSRARLRRIYAPHGSFIVFSREYFDRGGTLAHVPFLYGEEIMVAETARRLNLAVVYDPGFQIKHVEHSTTGKNPLVRQYQAESAKYCADAYFPLPGWRRESSRSYGMGR
jgi:hypothetical protein